MAQLKLFPKRKQALHHRTSKLHSSPVQTPIFPCYSTVNTNPTDYPVDNTSVNNDNDNPIKICSKTNYFFLHHLFKLNSFCFETSYRTLDRHLTK